MEYGGGDQKLIARFKCGNEERRNRYWKNDEENNCGLCTGNKETMEHLIGDCSGMTRTIKAVAEILRSLGEGVEWVREIINRRRQCENVVRL